jgi:hypothetical protein
MLAMVVFRRGLAPLGLPCVVASVAALGLLTDGPASADSDMCRVINVGFTPGGIAATDKDPEIDPQIVAWIEKPTGEYVDTVFITQQTGRYGLGNRPGRFDFNSGPGWPYGRRTTVFPVWAHKHGATFPQVEFQSGGENALSHDFQKSSQEYHYCKPLQREETLWDATTCSSTVYTDKGLFSQNSSGYPPRSDLRPVPGNDSASVPLYKMMNPFDAVSQATPKMGFAAQVSWPIPPTLADGQYVLMVEVGLEQDMNDHFNYPSPTGISYDNYGVAYRGQPSILYSVPFSIAETNTVAITEAYAGYGDPDGLDGRIRPPDSTMITTNKMNSGSQRLLLVSKDGMMYRVRVDSKTERDATAPASPGDMVVTKAEARDATLTFLAPGDDDMIGTVSGYDVRYVVGPLSIDDSNFDTANDVHFSGELVTAGQEQAITVNNLLPETQYTVAVRAFDNCHNNSRITTATFVTAPRPVGEVDACFIATAAYGSMLANDVEPLRRFRDLILRHSVLGELAVEAYYTFGPPVAGVVGESDLLRETARDVLTPVAAWVRGLRW